MSQSKLLPAPLSSNEARTVTLRHAIRLVRDAAHVGFASRLNDDGNHVIIDVSKALALRNLRKLKGRVTVVNVADIFGTTVIG